MFNNHLAKKECISLLDIGSSNTRCVIAQIGCDEDKPRIIGVGSVASVGMRKGVVVDLEEISSSIKAAVEMATRMAGFHPESVFVSVGGTHLVYSDTRGVIAIGRADGEVEKEDVERVAQAAQAVSLNNNYELLHIIPRKFILDDQAGIEDPLGMSGVRLEMKGTLVSGFSPHLKNIGKALQNLGIEVAGYIVGSLASAKASLNKRQEELGVALLDIGGGTTSLVVYEEREMIHMAVLPVGGGHITNDIAIGLRTSVETAEKIKIEFGSTLPNEIDKKEQINLAEFDSKEEGSVSRKHVAEIIEARAEEIFFLVEKELKKIHRSALLPAGVVLVGGTAKLHGMVDLAKRVLKLPAQTGFPVELSGLIDKTDDPAFSATIGMLLWVIDEQGVVEKKDVASGNGLGNFINKKNLEDWTKWFKKFLP